MSNYRLFPSLGTHTGQRREKNEDAIGYQYPSTLNQLSPYGALFVIADGVGGREEGELASQYVVDSLPQRYYSSQAETIEQRLSQSLQQINQYIYEQASQNATTVTAAVLQDEQLFVANVGDSRAYWLADKRITRITNDHSIQTDPQNNPTKFKLTRAIGHKSDLEVDVFQGRVAVGGRLVMVTDGITRYLSDEQIYEISQTKPPPEAVYDLILMANSAGGKDNISAVVVEIGAILEDEAQLNAHLQSLTPYVDLRNMSNLAQSPSPPETKSAQASPSETPPPADPIAVETEKTPNRPRLMPVLLLLLIMGLGAVAFFLLTTNGSDGDAADSAGLSDESATASPSSTESSSPIAAILIATSAPAPLENPSSSLDETSTEEVSTEEASLDKTVTAETIPNTDIQIDHVLTFRQVGVTFTAIEGNTAAFTIRPERGYRVLDIFKTRDEILWYQLQDMENEQGGWITEDDLPAYEILP